MHARASVERRNRETQETRAAAFPVSRLQSRAWSFACLGRFARRTKEKERLLVVYSANAEAMGLNPVQVPKFFWVNLQLLKLQLPLRRSYLHLNLYFRSSDHLQKQLSNANIYVRKAFFTCTFLSLQSKNFLFSKDIIEKHFFKSIYLQARQESGCLKGKDSPLSIAAPHIFWEDPHHPSHPVNKRVHS